MAHLSMSSTQTSASSAPSRRQFQSCDHCRYRRRKCDAGALGIDPYSTTSATGPRACTTCAKFGRVCTFSWLVERKQPRAFIEDRNGRRPVFARERREGKTLAPGVETRDAVPLIGSQSVHSSFSSDNRSPSGPRIASETACDRRQSRDVGPESTTLHAYDASWGLPPAMDTSSLVWQANDSNSTWPVCGSEALQPTSAAYLDDSSSGTDTMQEEGTNPGTPPIAALDLVHDGLATHSNKLNIAESLVSVYRENMEAIVTSWSTAMSCPYVSYNPQLAASTIYSRTTWVDRANRMDKLLPRLGLNVAASCANAHRNMESQVLNKVILAFASQWNSDSAPRQNVSQDPLAQTLQAIMQKTLWHDAKKELHKVSDRAGSFRIILARVIFSFVSDNMDRENLATDDSGTCSIVSDPYCSKQMEQALRDLLYWRQQLHKELRAIVKAGKALTIDQQSFLVDFNTFYWLSVMCDTTASAISGRPLVISDDDCAIENLYPEPVTIVEHEAATNGSASHIPSIRETCNKRVSLWNSIMVKDMNGTGYLSLAQENINPESIIEEAIPLKVLLFRHIGTLQKLLDAEASDHCIENAIQDGLLAYIQWQAKYSDFMNSFAEKYDSIPHRLRSWHIVLAAHWHYGVMLFAQKVQNIDSMQSDPTRRYRERQSACTPTSMTLDSAMQVAKLAHYCLEASHDSSISAHQGQNQLAMLSEPWCELMVRTLTMTAETLLYSDLAGVWYLVEKHIKTPHQGLCECIEVLEELGAHRYKTASRIAQSLRSKMTFAPTGDWSCFMGPESSFLNKQSQYIRV